MNCIFHKILWLWCINTVHSLAKILPIMYQNHQHYWMRNVLFQQKEVENVRHLKKCQYIKYFQYLKFQFLWVILLYLPWWSLGFSQVVSFISHYFIFVLCVYLLIFSPWFFIILLRVYKDPSVFSMLVYSQLYRLKKVEHSLGIWFNIQYVFKCIHSNQFQVSCSETMKTYIFHLARPIKYIL